MELITNLPLAGGSTSTATCSEVLRLTSVSDLYNYASKCQQEWSSTRRDLFLTHVEPQLAGLTTHEGERLIIQYLGEDLQWDWLNKALHTNSPEYDWFILQCDSKIQGVLVAYHPKKSHTESGDVFYIDYLAAAPWNRDTPKTKAQYRGIGTSLVATVADYYIRVHSYKPGFLLHSLPAAEGYYQGIGMTDLGIDPSKENLRQFEMGKTQCLGLLLRRRAS